MKTKLLWGGRKCSVYLSTISKVGRKWSSTFRPLHMKTKKSKISGRCKVPLSRSKAYSQTFDRPTGRSKADCSLSTVLNLKLKITDTQIHFENLLQSGRQGPAPGRPFWMKNKGFCFWTWFLKIFFKPVDRVLHPVDRPEWKTKYFVLNWILEICFDLKLLLTLLNMKCNFKKCVTCTCMYPLLSILMINSLTFF